jgi:uncharacterized iron-regulated protein
MKFSLTLSLLFSVFIVFGQQQPYVIYNSKGKKVTYKKLLKAADDSDIILFGEYHNNPISHWLQLELTKGLQVNNRLILGAEMFEADNQTALNQYLAGEIDRKGLDTLARLWNNYDTDYAPLVNFAKANNLPFIATNIPRKYASMVFKNGGFTALDGLSDLEKSWIAPLPIPFDATLPQYKKMLDMMGGHGGTDIVKAQAIKDATMAHFILENYKSGDTFLHYNGAFHSDFHEGILWYLQQQQTDLNYMTISTVSQKEVSKLAEENLGRADFIICVDEDMTTTY